MYIPFEFKVQDQAEYYFNRFSMKFNMSSHLYTLIFATIDLLILSLTFKAYWIENNEKESNPLLGYLFHWKDWIYEFLSVGIISILIFFFNNYKNSTLFKFSLKCIIRLAILFIAVALSNLQSSTEIRRSFLSNFDKLMPTSVCSGMLTNVPEFMQYTKQGLFIDYKLMNLTQDVFNVELEVDVMALQMSKFKLKVDVISSCPETGFYDVTIIEEMTKLKTWEILWNLSKLISSYGNYFSFICFLLNFNIKIDLNMINLYFTLVTIKPFDERYPMTYCFFIFILADFLSSFFYLNSQAMMFIIKNSRVKSSLKDEDNCLMKVLEIFKFCDNIYVKMSRTHIKFGKTKMRKSLFLKMYFTGVFMKPRSSFNCFERISVILGFDSSLNILRDHIIKRLFSKQGYVKDYEEYLRAFKCISKDLRTFREKCKEYGNPVSNKTKRLNAFLFRNVTGRDTNFTIQYPGEIYDFNYINIIKKDVHHLYVKKQPVLDPAYVSTSGIKFVGLGYYLTPVYEKTHHAEYYAEYRKNLNDVCILNNFRKSRLGFKELTEESKAICMLNQVKKLSKYKMFLEKKGKNVKNLQDRIADKVKLTKNILKDNNVKESNSFKTRLEQAQLGKYTFNPIKMRKVELTPYNCSERVFSVNRKHLRSAILQNKSLDKFVSGELKSSRRKKVFVTEKKGTINHPPLEMKFGDVTLKYSVETYNILKNFDNKNFLKFFKKVTSHKNKGENFIRYILENYEPGEDINRYKDSRVYTKAREPF